MTSTFTIESTPSGSDREFKLFERERDRRPLTEKADPLALAWAAYHVWEKFPGRRWADWADLEAFDHDRDMAAETRQYYRNKLAMRALKGNGEQTDFARDLYEICNGGIMRHCHKGMLYRLPYFYVEDTEHQALQESSPNQPRDLNKIPHFLIKDRETRIVRPQRRIFRTRRSAEVMEYWFRDDRDHPVAWYVGYENPLRSLVEQLYCDHQSLTVEAKYQLGHSPHTDFYYWHMLDVELRTQ